ncbi:MAG: hypothetical protein QGH83_01530, partial [Candidatus Pacebacteria bacterium]|nr:hypothetical protein [Candidatus Paceibacterota bacterium]
LEAGGGNIAYTGKQYICYAWTSIDGYSKFGSYIGNGNADGAFIYTGFKPAMVIIRKSSGAPWMMYDNKRNPYNLVNNKLAASHSSAENAGAFSTQSQNVMDFYSNGFKWRDALGNANGSDADYIYMAWAEMPFKYATER